VINQKVAIKKDQIEEKEDKKKAGANPSKSGAKA
jgi:hypothetical protein